MFQFLQSSNPALRAHLEAQFTLYRDMSEKMFEAADKMNQLSLQMTQNAIEESIQNTQQVLSAQSPYDALSAVASRVQPAADQLRNFQQQATTIAANTQVELAKTAETRLPEASRTAANVAQEVVQRTAEESERVSRRQREAVDKMSTRQSKPGQQEQRPGA
jgi:phasin family protein